MRASISRTENLGPVPAAQQGGTVERVALNTLARRWVLQARRSGDGDSIQRLGGKPLHLKPRGQRPQLHRTQTAPYPYAIRLPHPDSRPPM